MDTMDTSARGPPVPGKGRTPPASPGSPACRWQILGLPSFHRHARANPDNKPLLAWTSIHPPGPVPLEDPDVSCFFQTQVFLLWLSLWGCSQPEGSSPESPPHTIGPRRCWHCQCSRDHPAATHLPPAECRAWPRHRRGDSCSAQGPGQPRALPMASSLCSERLLPLHLSAALW